MNKNEIGSEVRLPPLILKQPEFESSVWVSRN